MLEFEDVIYVDNNATTPVDPRVKEEILPYLGEKYGNPNSMHQKGREARAPIDEARERVASLLNSRSEEIIFTSSATESNNHAIKGTACSKKQQGKHIITTKIEHKSVKEPINYLKKQGYKTTYLDVDKDGYIDLEELKDSVRDDTIFVSIMLANNEIGTIEPVKEAAQIIPDQTIFHTDAAQVPGKLEIDVDKLGIDLLTINGHKMYGPKGVGALYINEKTEIDPLLHGGGQELGRRSGTENVPYIVGLGKAAEVAEEEQKKDKEKLTKFQQQVIEEITQEVEKTKLNGPKEPRLPGNVNISFKGVEGEALVLRLDGRGISASTGSACASEQLEASYVLKEIGLKPEHAHSSLRIGFSRFNTQEDVDNLIKELKEVVKQLRSISAL
ncbi:cysteine desulfurase NifS [archaeon SCG-AAA382B04]|nr:cysteine desulfurase NifS [archaeon SCG-AAA382B04]